MSDPSPYSLSASLTDSLAASATAHRSAVSDYLYVVDQANANPASTAPHYAPHPTSAGYTQSPSAAPSTVPVSAPHAYQQPSSYRPPDLSPSPAGPAPPVSSAYTHTHTPTPAAAPAPTPTGTGYPYTQAPAQPQPQPQPRTHHTPTPTGHPTPAYASTYGYDGTHADRSVFDRLNDPATYTGVYAERFTSGPAINHASDAHRTPRGQAFPVATHLHQKVASYLSSKHHAGAKAHKAASHSVAYSDGLPYWALHESPRDRARRRSVAHRRPAGFKKGDFAASNNARLLLIFRYYCAFGLTGSKKADQDTICNTNFAKFTRECPLLLDSTDRIAGAGAGLNPTEVDMIFIQVKKDRHRRRLTYTEFLAALDRMAQVKYASDDPETAFSKLLINHVFPSEGAQVVEAAEAMESDMAMFGGGPGTDHLSSDPASPYPGMSPSPSFRPPVGHPGGSVPPSPVPLHGAAPSRAHTHPPATPTPTAGTPASGTPMAMPPPPPPGAAHHPHHHHPGGPPTPGYGASPVPGYSPSPGAGAAHMHGHGHGHGHGGHGAGSVMSDMSTASAAVRRANVAEARRRHREAHYKAPPERRKTIAGEANRPGGVFDRLSNPATFTGVYRRAWYSDGRINHYADTMVSNIPSQYEGDTNTKTDEIITDISVLLRPGLRYGKGLK